MPHNAPLQLQQWLLERQWDLFVTLAFNSQSEKWLGYPTVNQSLDNDKLKTVDAFVCRELLGRNWAKKPDERPLWIGYLKKAETHPHWHLLVNFAYPEQKSQFTEHLETGWQKYVHTGSTDCRDYVVASTGEQRMSDPVYVTKELTEKRIIADGLDSMVFSPTYTLNQDIKTISAINRTKRFKKNNALKIKRNELAGLSL